MLGFMSIGFARGQNRKLAMSKHAALERDLVNGLQMDWNLNWKFLKMCYLIKEVPRIESLTSQTTLAALFSHPCCLPMPLISIDWWIGW